MAETIYKYLSADLALRVMEERRLKVSLLPELNDVFDCSPRLSPPPDDTDGHNEQSWTDHVIRQNGVNYGLLCFSKDLANPLQWGHYAACGAGIALGFDPDKFAWKNPIDVRYDRGRPHLEWAGEDQMNAAFTEKMMRCSFGVKAVEWAYEKEVRYVLSLDTCEAANGMYFAKFRPEALVEVVLGFRCRVPLEYIKRFIGQRYDKLPVAIRKTSPHAENYEIVASDVE